MSSATKGGALSIILGSVILTSVSKTVLLILCRFHSILRRISFLRFLMLVPANRYQ